MTIETNQDGDRLIFGEPATFEIRYQTEMVEWRVIPRAFELFGGDPDRPTRLGRWQVQLQAEATHTPAAGTGRETHTDSFGYDTRILDREPTEWMLGRLAEEALDTFPITCPDCDGTGEVWEPLDEDGDGYADTCVHCHGGGQIPLGDVRRARQQEQAVSVATIAESLDVTPRTVHGWVKRYPEFPAPVLDNPLGRFYDLEQVKTWHAEKQPRAGRPKG